MTIKKIMVAALSAVLCVVLSAAAFAESLVPGGGAVGVLRRRDVQLLCLAAALDRNGRFAAVKLRERRFEVLRRADVGSAQPRYDVALF